MNQELVSIIVPAFNVESFFPACIDSILDQSYKNIELIIINDGSSDFTPKIAESYALKDDRVKVYHQENVGPAARNKGLDLATGQFVMFIDSDDMLLPRAIEVMMRMMVKYQADIVEGKTITGKIHGDLTPPSVFHPKIYTPQKAIHDVLYQKNLLASVCGKLYKMSLFENLRFSNGLLYEDLDIFYKIFERADKIIFIDFPVYFYRNNDNSIINSWSKRRLDVLKVTENIENYMREKYPEILPAAKDRRLSANFNMFILCSINDEKENADKCWEIIKQNRRASLFNPNVRTKNKAGILLSYMGKNVFKFISGFFY